MSKVAHLGGQPVRKIAFSPPPALWEITYTDCFSINTLHDPEEVEEIISEVSAETANAEVEYRPDAAQLFTSDQMVVELMREKLFGREIASIHIHIPHTSDDPF